MGLLNRVFRTPDSNFDGFERAVGPVIVGSTVPVASSSFFGWVRDSFAGSWQRGIVADQPQNLLAFSAVYSCVTLISNDVAKLCPMMMQETPNGLWEEVDNTPLANVLYKPNRYQTWLQFAQQWISSKLMHGNAYVVKERDARKVVVAMYVVNPFYVKPLIAIDGSVWYQISRDYLIGYPEDVTLPASEVIHDRCPALWHPLVGVAPLYACGATATQGIRIQNNSKKFFENMSMPSGQLSSPNKIDDITANRLKETFETNFSGPNGIGRVFVGGLGLKFEPITIPADQAQLIDQLKWTVEDVARAFSVPLYKVGGQLPASFNSVVALNQDYYSQCLQIYITAMEYCLKEGLELDKSPPPYKVILNLDDLFRMDPLGRAESDQKEIQAGILAPNEARAKRNLQPVTGGDTPYLQQQNYSLAALAARDAAGPAPTGPSPSVTPAAPEPPPTNKGTVIEGEFTVDVDQFEQLLLEAA